MRPKKSTIAAIALAVTLLSAVSLSTYVNEQVALQTLSQKQRKLPVYCVEREDKTLSISFDCAWGVEYTDTILEALDKNEVHCTFFAVEFWVKKYPEYAKKIVEAGHELGTHSKTHPYMSKLSSTQIDEELSSSCAAIQEATGVRPTLFRAPYGDYNNLLIERAQANGLYTIQWDVDSLDWKNLSATEIALRIINGAKSGSIILCHNNGLHTAEALPMIFSTLKNRGYRFVPIGDLIYKTDYTIDHTGKQHPQNTAG
ncbi:MAG: polysaccharide deacetylase family protein [Clostridia bacterium]|nr:polysaccharide deacetylase family protein [Clostridia bacterium]